MLRKLFRWMMTGYPLWFGNSEEFLHSQQLTKKELKI